MDENCNVLGKKILYLRKRHLVTKTELSKFLGCSVASIRLWETGKVYPSSYYLPLIADRFHVSIDYLFGRER